MKTENRVLTREEAIEKWEVINSKRINFMKEFLEFIKTKPSDNMIKDKLITSDIDSAISDVYLLFTHMHSKELLKFYVEQYGAKFVRQGLGIMGIIKSNDDDTIKYLIEHGLPQKSTLIQAIHFDKINIVKSIVEMKHYNISLMDLGLKENAMRRALQVSKNDEIINFLLENFWIGKWKQAGDVMKEAIQWFQSIRKNQLDISILTQDFIKNLARESLTNLANAALMYNRVDILKLLKLYRPNGGIKLFTEVEAIDEYSIDSLRYTLNDKYFRSCTYIDNDLNWILQFKSFNVNDKESDVLALAKFFIEEYGLTPTPILVEEAKKKDYLEVASYLESKVK